MRWYDHGNRVIPQRKRFNGPSQFFPLMPELLFGLTRHLYSHTFPSVKASVASIRNGDSDLAIKNR